jgi:metal-sulfur cluster biosynthetic enzyme
LTGAVAVVQMTLMSKDSPFRATVEADVRRELMGRHPELTRVDVDLVWDPVWQEHFMTEEGVRQRDFPIKRYIPTPESPLTSDDIRDSLKYVLDPEVGINIVDLGLVYDIALQANKVAIEMTMTTRACPLQATIEDAVNRTLQIRHPELDGVKITIVWEPPWGVERISAEGRTELGW